MKHERAPVLQEIGAFERILPHTLKLAGCTCEVLPLRPLPHEGSHILAKHGAMEFGVTRLPLGLVKVSTASGKATVIVPVGKAEGLLLDGQPVTGKNIIFVPPGGVAFLRAKSASTVSCFSFPYDGYVGILSPDPAALLSPPLELSQQLCRTSKTLIRKIIETSFHNPQDVDITSLASTLEGLPEALNGLISKRDGMPLVSSERIRLMTHIDTFISDNISNAIYLRDVANIANVSVRTIHNATVAMSGLAFTRLLKARRAWKAYQEFFAATDHRFIKTVALVNGFWHLGDFSGAYMNQFGELPSDTRKQARFKKEFAIDDPHSSLDEQFRPVLELKKLASCAAPSP